MQFPNSQFSIKMFQLDSLDFEITQSHWRFLFQSWVLISSNPLTPSQITISKWKFWPYIVSVQYDFY